MVGVAPAIDGKGAEAVVRFEDTERGPVEDGAKQFPLRTQAAGEDPVGVAVAPMHKGDAAPFDGTLFSPGAVALVMAEMEACPKRIAAEVDHAKGVMKAGCDMQVAGKQAELNAERKKREAEVLSRDKQIEMLSGELASSKDQPIWLWVGGGAVGGATLVILGVLAAGAL